MTAKQFYDWQTSGGTDDVMRLVDCLERADVAWCAIGGVAVNHWAEQPMVTQDVDFVVASDSIERTVSCLEEAGFHSERFEWSINFQGHSAVSIQLSTEDFYRDFPSRAVPADVHGILLRVASLEDTLRGKIRHGPSLNEGKANESKILPILPGWWRHIPISGTCSPTNSNNKFGLQRSDRPNKIRSTCRY